MMARLDKNSQRKLVDNIRYVARMPKVVADTHRRYPVGGGGNGGQIGKVTTTITARSGSAYGGGAVTLQIPDDTGHFVDGATGVSVINPYNGSIATGIFVTLVYVSGKLTVFNAECP